MKIKMIVLGKLKEKYLKDGIGEYVKRMSRFCDTEIIELNDEKIPDNPSQSEEKTVLAKEAERIKKHIGQKDYVISLCVEGKQLTSEELASKMSDISLSGYSTVDFIIGGSLGLDPEIKQLSHLKLSFSKFTFPHQLMRLILTEQLYRAFKINNNETYHK
ncbi:MAG: 23S rRNA (pseudouridine(1915)-N(3))-methyltransferase RlmH [Clostridia bacterium]|nr:23S rRNA (pseudouridine(1915)-N(3))-methyltransferase RlmH [Clostridia bacterium]